MPVSVRLGAAIRTVENSVSVLVVVFSAAEAWILQLKEIIIVLESLFAFTYAFCHLDFFLATIVLNSHIHKSSSAIIVTCIATAL